MIRVEANLLRLPLFALHTRGLRSLNAVEYQGVSHRGEAPLAFTFRAVRNAATMYPGPLARAAHFALLSLLSDRGHPLANPITWSWRELCRRMDIACSGRTVERLKSALHSTAGLYITSHQALYSKPEGHRISTREDGLRLYERVCFLGTLLPDGQVADTNHLWLAEWYLANLNALFTAPLDYELWLRLDRCGPIASRLYEILLINFYNGMPTFRINYETLAALLPAKRERHPSQARQQLGPALDALCTEGVLSAVEWTQSRDLKPQLLLHRGPRLASGSRATERPRNPGPDLTASPPSPTLHDLHPEPPALEPVPTPVVARTSIPSTHSHATDLIQSFRRLWAEAGGPSLSAPTTPAPRELALADRLIADYGLEALHDLLPRAVRLLRLRWPTARTLTALASCLPEAAAARAAEHAQAHRSSALAESRRAELERDRRQAEADAAFRDTWRPAWLALPESDREAIRQSLLRSRPFLARSPSLLEHLCLEALCQSLRNSLATTPRATQSPDPEHTPPTPHDRSEAQDPPPEPHPRPASVRLRWSRGKPGYPR